MVETVSDWAAGAFVVPVAMNDKPLGVTPIGLSDPAGAVSTSTTNTPEDSVPEGLRFAPAQSRPRRTAP